MSARLDGNIILLEGQCRVEDAEPLLGWLQADSSRVVDLTDAEHLHAAVFQILMALRPPIRAPIREGEKDAFVQDWLIPILRAAKSSDAG
jgi:hypothetical protein